MVDQLAAAEAAVDAAAGVVAAGADTLARLAGVEGRVSVERLDAHQVVAYDLAHAAAGVEACRSMLRWGVHGEVEATLARAFVADTVWDVACRLLGRSGAWGVDGEELDAALPFVEAHRSPEFVARAASVIAVHGTGPDHLGDDLAMARDAFHRFAAERVRPVAEHVHRTNADIPESVITGLAALGGFGLSIPDAFGGSATGGATDLVAVLVATEELSWASLGIGGSLITRPEILARALLTGGTDEQKRRFLPRIASGDAMVGVTVTEPDHGSDVAGITVAATPADGGWRVNGTKTWATFAGRADLLMLLARTDPDRSKGHRGLSLFVVEKDPCPGHAFALDQPEGGRMEGRAIDTLGYRGMHSYEVAFTDWFVPAANLVGGPAGEGRGFYLQMAGFDNGRLQTAARAVGLMQAAFDAAHAYAHQRHVFGRPVASYPINQAKLLRMATLTAAGRQHSYDVARATTGDHTLATAMVKAHTCRAAEWVTREAMQIHGGMGYAEELPVSRYYADARVLSIFEGTDETLALRVIARRLAEHALARH